MLDLKELATRVFLETLSRIEPGLQIRDKLLIDAGTLSVGGEQIALDRYNEVVLIGMGKASMKMGAAIEALLGDRITRGILVTNHRFDIDVRCEAIVAGHPLPDSESLRAGERIIALLQSCGDDSLIIFLISGGGSSLVELSSSEEISLEDLRTTNQILIGCGASIHEINVVRKSLSKIKGGRLGYLARESKRVGLYVSDVNPGDIRSIASNPLLPEAPERDVFLDVIERYNLRESLPDSVVRTFDQENLFRFEGEGYAAEKNPLTMLLMDNSDALHAAAEAARKDGFYVEVDYDMTEGGYQSVADESIKRLLDLRSRACGPVCRISGGEVSCPVQGSGVGGRNQEFVLYSAAHLAYLGLGDSAAVLSCGTDGIDGNSTAAGAVADGNSTLRAAQLGEDASSYISANDSHTFFKKMGGLVLTGPTGNNVRDIRVLMAQ
jgi:glycerate 2-kinase